MNKQTHLAAWDQMRLRHGITLRLLDQLPEGKLNSHPIPGMRTPVELVVHMYASLETWVDGVVTGTMPPFDEAAAAAAITTKGKLLAFVNKHWAAGDKKARSLTDVQLGASVKATWGGVYPGAAVLDFVHDEYLHHRGQLYAFTRVFGIEPVMLWDYEHNAPEFGLKEHAQG